MGICKYWCIPQYSWGYWDQHSNWSLSEREGEQCLRVVLAQEGGKGWCYPSSNHGRHCSGDSPSLPVLFCFCGGCEATLVPGRVQLLRAAGVVDPKFCPHPACPCLFTCRAPACKKGIPLLQDDVQKQGRSYVAEKQMVGKILFPPLFS